MQVGSASRRAPPFDADSRYATLLDAFLTADRRRRGYLPVARALDIYQLYFNASAYELEGVQLTSFVDQFARPGPDKSSSGHEIMVVEYLQLAQALRQRDEEILLRERFAPRVAAAAPGGGTSPVARTCRANDLSVGGAAALPGCGSPDLGGPGTPPAGASYRSSRPPALVTAPFGCSAGASLGSPALGGSGKLSSGGRSGEPSPLSPYAGAASGAYGGRIAAAVPTHPASLSRHAHQSPTSQSYPNLPSPSPNAGLSPHGSSHGSGLGPGSFGSGSGSGSLGAALAAASLGPGSAGGSAHYGGAGYSCDPAGVGALGGAGIGGGGSGASPLEHSPRWGAAARKMLAYPSAGEPEQSAAAAWPGARAAASALSPGGGGVASTAEARGEIIARCRVVGEL